MQDRYAGDVGDFGKYGLLRALVDKAPQALRLAIVWCLNPNESHNQDGRHTSYLRLPDYRMVDPYLHDRLRDIVRADSRTVAAIVEAQILPADTISFSDLVSAKNATTKHERLAARLQWIDRALSTTAVADLVFFDPDNGIESRSIPRSAPKAGKYIYWDELSRFWNRGQSLIIYHHSNRTMPVADQIAHLRKCIRSELPQAASVTPLIFRRGSCRVFWVVARKDHHGTLDSGIRKMLRSGWNEHFEVA